MVQTCGGLTVERVQSSVGSMLHAESLSCQPLLVSCSASSACTSGCVCEREREAHIQRGGRGRDVELTVLSLSFAINWPARSLQEVSELLRRNLCSSITTHSSHTPHSTRHWSPAHSSVLSHLLLCTAPSNASPAYDKGNNVT